MKADFHMHTSFSTDSETSPEKMIERAIELGLQKICITDHEDLDFPEEGFVVDFETYFEQLPKLQEKYKDQIEVRIGVELGLQTHLGERLQKIVDTYPFDFVLGSVHVLDGTDPHCGKYFQNRTDEEGYREAFEHTLNNIRTIQCFDVLGHMDYVVRYGHQKAASYSYKKYADIIDEVLRTLIAQGKGIELNTAGLKYGIGFAHPHSDVLKRYRELGGEIITVGSDGHRPEHLAYEFGIAKQILLDSGFKYYTDFCQRKPEFCAIL